MTTLAGALFLESVRGTRSKHERRPLTLAVRDRVTIANGQNAFV
jgi:hypothetical protein